MKHENNYTLNQLAEVFSQLNDAQKTHVVFIILIACIKQAITRPNVENIKQVYRGLVVFIPAVLRTWRGEIWRGALITAAAFLFFLTWARFTAGL